MKNKHKVLFFTDKHYPFNDPNHDKFILNTIRKEKPTVVIDGGDLYDQYFYSGFDKDFNLMCPEEELNRAYKQAKSFWAKVRKIVPRAKLIQLSGNHDVRMTKQTLKKMPTLVSNVEDLRRSYYDFPGVEVRYSDRDYVEYDNVVYCHGWLGSKFAHVNVFNKSVVHGHFHKASLVAKQDIKTGNKFLFELCAGCGLDPKSVPARYTASKVIKGQKALGIIDKGYPRLVLMEE